MANEWYYKTSHGDRQGPVSDVELKKLAMNGILSPTDLIWKDPMTEWKPASNVRGLFPEAPQTPPPLPVQPPVQGSWNSPPQGQPVQGVSNYGSQDKQLSSTPLILGVVGFILNLPSILCSFLCAGMIVGATSGIGQDGGAAGGMAMVLPLIVMAVSGILGFVACFYTKSKNAKKAAYGMIISGGVVVLPALMSLAIFAIAGGICYIVGGILALENAKMFPEEST